MKVILVFYLQLTFGHRPVADWAKGTGAGQFLYISSAGIYKPTDEPPHVEGVSLLSSKISSAYHAMCFLMQ